MLDINKRINEYKKKSRNKCFALLNWNNLKVKNYTLDEMLTCIYNAADGSFSEMDNIIDHLTDKRKVFGRTQVYGAGHIDKVDIVRDETGELQLTGYNSDDPLTLKGQRIKRNNKIFRKSDDQISKNFQKSEEKIFDLGEKVRKLYPNEDNHFITFAMQAIKKHADARKISPDKVVKGIEKGRYVIDTDLWRVIPNVKNESITKRTIIINEEDMSRLSDGIKMTEYKFHNNIRNFIGQLLQDPVNAQPSFLLKANGINRSTLLKELIDSGLIIRNEHISDKDENGLPKTATMMVKFKCPKKNFDRKIQKLFIKLFEKNLPQRKKSFNSELNEDGEGGACGGATSAASSGQFIQPFGNVQRRKMPVEIDETTATTNVGDYEYDVPAFGDEETLARKNGVGGSISINKA